jgi:hypothetical protein
VEQGRGARNLRPVHAKAMPAILTTPEHLWMSAPTAEALSALAAAPAQPAPHRGARRAGGFRRPRGAGVTVLRYANRLRARRWGRGASWTVAARVSYRLRWRVAFRYKIRKEGIRQPLRS